MNTGTIKLPPAVRMGGITINAKNVTKSFNGKTLIKNFSFSLPKGGIIGVIGPNGAGKTTLLRLLSGLDQPDEGEVEIGSTVAIGYSQQIRDHVKGTNTVYAEISEGKDTLLIGTTQINMRSFVAEFNFRGSEQEKLVESLSGGERNRMCLAKVLKSESNVLFLDEPSNDLDLDVLRNLEEALEEYGGSAVIVSHDRWFLNRICTHILSYEGDGKISFFEGNYQDYLAALKVLGKTVDKKPKRFKKLGV